MKTPVQELQTLLNQKRKLLKKYLAMPQTVPIKKAVEKVKPVILQYEQAVKILKSHKSQLEIEMPGESIPNEKEFQKCCAEHIRSIWIQCGPTLLLYNGNCPICDHYIGLTHSSIEYANNFLKKFGLQPLPEAITPTHY